MSTNQEKRDIAYTSLEEYQNKVNDLNSQLNQFLNNYSDNAQSFEKRLSEALKNFHSKNSPSIDLNLLNKKLQLNNLKIKIQICLSEILTLLQESYGIKTSKKSEESILEYLQKLFNVLYTKSDIEEFTTDFPTINAYLTLIKTCNKMLNLIDTESQKLDNLFNISITQTDDYTR